MSMNARHARHRGHHRASREALENPDTLVVEGLREVEELREREARIQAIMTDADRDRESAEDIVDEQDRPTATPIFHSTLGLIWDFDEFIWGGVP